jgi:inosine/xanthosine triphosphatase
MGETDVHIVSVGSTNKSKINGVSRAWKHFAPAKIVSVNVKPSVPRQPLSWRQTILGGIERAKQALDTVGNADYGVGIEAGLLPAPFPSGFIEAQVAIIVDKEYNLTMGMSSGFEVPYVMLQDLLRGEELGKVAEKFYHRKDIGESFGIIGMLTSGAVTRSDLSYQAVLNALLPRMNQKVYGPLKKIGWYIERLQEQSF